MFLEFVAIGALTYHVDLLGRIHAESVLGFSAHQYHVGVAVEDHMVHVVALAVLHHAFALEHDAGVVGPAAVLFDCINLKECAGLAGVVGIKGVAEFRRRGSYALAAARIQDGIGLLVDVQGNIALVAPAIGVEVIFGLILLVVETEEQLAVEFVVVVENLCVVACQLNVVVGCHACNLLGCCKGSTQVGFATAEYLGTPQICIGLKGKSSGLVPVDAAAGSCTRALVCAEKFDGLVDIAFDESHHLFLG